MAALTCSIVWFKHSNLRLHDNEAFYKAHAPAGGHSAVLHVFVFDPFWFGRTSFGFLKTGHFRARFLLESLVDLRANLKKQGSTLIVRTGYAPDVLASLVEATKATRVYSQAETCSEEQAIDREVQKSVAAKGASLVSCWGGSTMYDLQDLPFTLNLASGSASGGAASAIAAGATGHSKKPQCFPQIYTQFRKTVESTCTIREPLPAVPLKPLPFPSASLPACPPLVLPCSAVAVPAEANEGEGKLPSLQAFGVASPSVHLDDLSRSLDLARGGFNVVYRGTSPPFAASSCSDVPPSSGAGNIGLTVPSSSPKGYYETDAEVLALPLTSDARGVLAFKGGETAALARLQHYFWGSKALSEYKLTRNRLLGADYSSKFSPWLSFGNISPRYIAAMVKRYEAEHGANDSTYWLLFELLWRDFFRFASIGWGKRLFRIYGPRGEAAGTASGETKKWLQDYRLFKAWASGKTGWPFVDANMRELLLTGFMSNRGRQNVASFLTKDMDIDWRIGAEWFEALLVDHDPCSNYGNWQYSSGVGSDPREDRYFLIPKQAKDYDGRGDYMRHWLPELQKGKLGPAALFDPRNISDEQKAAIAPYPSPPVVALMAHRSPRPGASGPVPAFAPGEDPSAKGERPTGRAAGGSGRDNRWKTHRRETADRKTAAQWEDAGASAEGSAGGPPPGPVSSSAFAKRRGGGKVQHL